MCALQFLRRNPEIPPRRAAERFGKCRVSFLVLSFPSRSKEPATLKAFSAHAQAGCRDPEPPILARPTSLGDAARGAGGVTSAQVPKCPKRPNQKGAGVPEPSQQLFVNQGSDSSIRKGACDPRSCLAGARWRLGKNSGCERHIITTSHHTSRITSL